MSETEHTLVLTFAQTIKTKRVGNFHRRLHLVVQEDDPMLLFFKTERVGDFHRRLHLVIEEDDPMFLSLSE